MLSPFINPTSAEIEPDLRIRLIFFFFSHKPTAHQSE